MSEARTEVLRRIRAANGADRPDVPIERAYGREPVVDGVADERVLDLLVERIRDYRADVTRTTAAQLPAAIATALGGARAVVVPVGLERRWTQGVTGVVVDDGSLTAQDLDAVDAVLTAATVACAETGTFVLDGSSDQGRRAISLVPDRHVCVIRSDQVVASVPQLVSRLRPERPLTFVSGPSATSDIELQRVEGVHGPRTLHVVLVG